VVWKNQEEYRDGVTSRDMVPHGVHMVYAWMTEMKSSVIRRKYGQTLGRVRIRTDIGQ